MIRKIAGVEHNDEEYDLVLYGWERHTNQEKDKPKKVFPSWAMLTVVKKEDNFQQLFDKHKRKHIVWIAASLLSVLVGTMLFALVIDPSKRDASGFLLFFIAVMSLLIGITGFIFSLAFLIYYSTGSFGERYVKLTVEKHREKLSQYSLINSREITETWLSDTKKNVISFINKLSQEELVEFLVKGYERGDVAIDLNNIENILNNDEKISKFLEKEAEKTANELRDEVEVHNHLNLLYTNRYKKHLAIESYEGKMAKTKKNQVKTSDDRLLEVLSKRNAV